MSLPEMRYDNVWNMQVILLWILQLTRCTGGYCPDDLWTEVISCLKNLTHNDANLLGTSDPKRMKDNCEYGNFNDSVECLRKLYKKCDRPSDMERLQKYAKPTAWQSGFDRFCKGSSKYVRHSSCIAQQDREMNECLKPYEQLYSSDSGYVEYSVEEREQENFNRICSLYFYLNKCLHSTIGENCGEKIGATLSDFLGGLTPPMCRNFDLPNGAPSLFVGTQKTLFQAILMIVLWSLICYLLNT